jgi:hypothetical protein
MSSRSQPHDPAVQFEVKRRSTVSPTVDRTWEEILPAFDPGIHRLLGKEAADTLIRFVFTRGANSTVVITL